MERMIREHEHNGIQATQNKYFDMFGETPSNVPLRTATIGTAAASYDDYVIAPISGRLISIDFSAVDALAASDTNYITWVITNLGQLGAGSVAMLATLPAGINTTKATGGTAIAANTKYKLITSETRGVAKGDRLLVRATVTGTLPNSVTLPTYCLRFI